MEKRVERIARDEARRVACKEMARRHPQEWQAIYLAELAKRGLGNRK